MRFRTVSAKVGIVLSAVVVSAVVGAIVGEISVSPWSVPVFTVLATAATVVFTARTFRGEDERVVPARPWWKLTGGRVSAVVMAMLFLGQGALLLLQPTVAPGPGALAIASCVAWGSAYLYSAARMSRPTP